jgi:outer membrane receptor protein involved in Fe transport
MNINKLLFGLFLVIAPFFNLQAEKHDGEIQDTIQSHELNEVVISASTKETNDLKTLPSSVSIITPQMMEGQRIIAIKDLSMIIPNFFIPDYGSKLSVPVYIRGIGERSTGQSIGLYVNNIPYMDKSVFDFDFIDIQQIEVLRGPQGTLYGRNAMSGIVNITTRSPLEGRYGRILLSGGNYGYGQGKVSFSELLGKNVGISMNLNVRGNKGYFKNQYANERADNLTSAEAGIRLDWRISSQWNLRYTFSLDTCRQGAFPYGEYVNGEIMRPNYNYSGSYRRETWTNNLNLQYKNDKIVFNSSTGFQHFKDDMKMDTDNKPLDVFRLNQLQRENVWTEELTLKSNTRNNYQWSFGVFGFYNNLKTNVVTTMGEDGIATILQPAFDQIHANNPRAPIMTVLNAEIPIPGAFRTPVYGGAIFHQSTYNDLFIEGLSLTAGIRLDYEKPQLDYSTFMNTKLDVAVSAGPNIIHIDSTLAMSLQGKESMRFTEILPKIALKYKFNSGSYAFATVSNGYKTGGYNIQNFADIIQGALREKYDKSFHAASVSDLVPYRPEYSWNYELGYKGEWIKDLLYAEIAAFYIDVKDVQLTEFVASGQGRVVKNAGKARSLGADFSVTAHFTPELSVTANYGFSQATFRDYKIKNEADSTILFNYTGNHIPFAPQHTFSLSAVYIKKFYNQWINRFHFQAQYNGAGRIYWTEKNDVYQDFYGLLNLRAGANKGIVGLNLWANNVLNTDYAAFYFESMGRGLAQKGKPVTFGVDLSISF